MAYYGYPRYVPVAKRRERAQRALKKLQKKGFSVEPLALKKPRHIATTFWGRHWCDHIESLSTFANRLPRGRTYVRNGSVCHLSIQKGVVQALVSGSRLYSVEITIEPLKKAHWERIKKQCAGHIGSLLDLLSGELSQETMALVCTPNQGLFPATQDIHLACDCPDWARLCKHTAAVLYGVGSRLDQHPEHLFLLRGVNHEALIDLSPTLTEAPLNPKRRRLDTTTLSEVFNIDLAEATTPQEKTDLKKHP